MCCLGYGWAWLGWVGRCSGGGEAVARCVCTVLQLRPDLFAVRAGGRQPHTGPPPPPPGRHAESCNNRDITLSHNARPLYMDSRPGSYPVIMVQAGRQAGTGICKSSPSLSTVHHHLPIFSFYIILLFLSPLTMYSNLNLMVFCFLSHPHLSFSKLLFLSLYIFRSLSPTFFLYFIPPLQLHHHHHHHPLFSSPPPLPSYTLPCSSIFSFLLSL